MRAGVLASSSWQPANKYSDVMGLGSPLDSSFDIKFSGRSNLRWSPWVRPDFDICDVANINYKSILALIQAVRSAG